MQKQTQTPGNVNRSQSQHSSSTAQTAGNDSTGNKLATQNQGTNSTARVTDEAIDVLSFMGFKL